MRLGNRRIRLRSHHYLKEDSIMNFPLFCVGSKIHSGCHYHTSWGGVALLVPRISPGFCG